MRCAHCNKNTASYSHTSKKYDKSLFICEVCLNTKYHNVRLYELRRIDAQPLDSYKFKTYRRRGKMVSKIIRRCVELYCSVGCANTKVKFCDVCLIWVCEKTFSQFHIKCLNCNKCYIDLKKCRICQVDICPECLCDEKCKKCTLAPLRYFMSSRRPWIQSAKETKLFDKNICLVIVPLLFQGGSVPQLKPIKWKSTRPRQPTPEPIIRHNNKVSEQSNKYIYTHTNYYDDYYDDYYDYYDD